VLLVLLLPPPPLPFAVTTTINNTNNNHYQIHCATSTSTLVVLFCLFVLVVLPCVPVLCFVVLTSCLIGVGSGAGRSLPPLCLNCCVLLLCCVLVVPCLFVCVLLFVDCCVDFCCDRGRLWRRSLTTTPFDWFCCCAVVVLFCYCCYHQHPTPHPPQQPWRPMMANSHPSQLGMASLLAGAGMSRKSIG
jgi:hypothetical protein